jgi:hypothetical protein
MCAADSEECLVIAHVVRVKRGDSVARRPHGLGALETSLGMAVTVDLSLSSPTKLAMHRITCYCNLSVGEREVDLVVLASTTAYETVIHITPILPGPVGCAREGSSHATCQEIPATSIL